MGDVVRFEYFVLRTNFTDMQAIRNNKALEADTFVTSGLVEYPRAKELPGDRVPRIAGNRHVQGHSAAPPNHALPTWSPCSFHVCGWDQKIPGWLVCISLLNSALLDRIQFKMSSEDKCKSPSFECEFPEGTGLVGPQVVRDLIVF